MNSKRKFQLYNSLKKLENNCFEENDIRLLLIEIRDLLEKESFLREICNFVAHPDRDKGICHNTINSRHAKMKFLKDGMEKLIADGIPAKNPGKDWSFFSNIALGYMQTSKIEKKLFQIIIIEGIKEIPEEKFIEYYNMTKLEVDNLISKVYKIDKGYYVISDKINEKQYIFIDDLLKFIRGTITGKSAFTQEDIICDLSQGIARIINKENFDIDSKKIEIVVNEIIVCIISVLHDATFILFDNSIARSYMTITKNDRLNGGFLNIDLYADATNFHFPIITTTINIQEYIDTTNDELEKFVSREIPWINAVRNNGKLKLIKTVHNTSLAK